MQKYVVLRVGMTPDEVVNAALDRLEKGGKT